MSESMYPLMDAPGCFQHFMEQCLHGNRDELVIPYFEKVSFILKKYRLKIRASKFQFFKQEISYLGQLVSAEVYTTDPKNIINVTFKISKQPKTVSELYTLLSLFDSFWRSIPNLSKIATPFYDLLKNLPEKSAKHPVLWNKQFQYVLDTLLPLITRLP